MHQVVIIGGGLAGLVNALLLNRAGVSVALVEKNAYPHHKVCGEYVSNEVKPFLIQQQLFPAHENFANINQFLLSSVSGRSASSPLDLGGFGISRYTLDNFLFEKAKKEGVDFYLQQQAREVISFPEYDEVVLSDGTRLSAKLVIGAYGKRSVLDKSLNRDFLKKRSGYIAVKYHIKTDHPAHTIALHNFKGGYCGISKVENETFNLCYLGRREHLKQFGSIPEMEKNILYRNPHLKDLFCNSDFLFKEPLVINEFSFQRKHAVEGGVLMSGDAAGLITPLCGNGMALAIHSAKLLSGIIARNYRNGDFDKPKIFDEYRRRWKNLFAFRLWVGRTVQHLFGSEFSSEIAVHLLRNSKLISHQIIKNTHGRAF